MPRLYSVTACLLSWKDSSARSPIEEEEEEDLMEVFFDDDVDGNSAGLIAALQNFRSK